MGEPPVEQAIALESTVPADHEHADGSAAHSHAEEDAVVSRTVQRTIGLWLSTVLVGIALGGLVGLAAAYAVGRLGSLSPAQSTAVVGLAGFVSFALVPFWKYPANPPAVGSADTIGERTALYFSFVAVSLLAVVAAVLLARALLARGPWVAVVAGAALYVVVVGVAGLVLAPIDEVPDSFPATTLYAFRIGSLATSTALWAGVALALTGLTARTWRAHQADVERRAAAAAL